MDLAKEAEGPTNLVAAVTTYRREVVKILKKREDTLKLSEQVEKYCGILLQIIEHFLLTATAAQVLRRVSNEKR